MLGFFGWVPCALCDGWLGTMKQGGLLLSAVLIPMVPEADLRDPGARLCWMAYHPGASRSSFSLPAMHAVVGASVGGFRCWHRQPPRLAYPRSRSRFSPGCYRVVDYLALASLHAVVDASVGGLWCWLRPPPRLADPRARSRSSPGCCRIIDSLALASGLRVASPIRVLCLVAYRMILYTMLGSSSTCLLPS